MRVKRNFIVIMIFVVSILGAMTIYAATSDTDVYKYTGKAKLTAYSYIGESGFGLHNGTSRGNLTGEDRDSVGDFLVTSSFGSTVKTQWIGYNKDTYGTTQRCEWFFEYVTTAISHLNAPYEDLFSVTVKAD